MLDMNNNGPIPGENFTSDTKNYPWHRPAELNTVDEAIEDILKRLRKPRANQAIVSMIELGLDIASITDIFLMKGVERGKWSIDLAILLAGPVSHIIVLMAKAYELDYNLGIDDNPNVPTSAFFNEMKKSRNKKQALTDETNKEIEKVAEEAKGFLKGFMA